MVLTTGNPYLKPMYTLKDVEDVSTRFSWHITGRDEILVAGCPGYKIKEMVAFESRTTGQKWLRVDSLISTKMQQVCSIVLSRE